MSEYEMSDEARRFEARLRWRSEILNKIARAVAAGVADSLAHSNLDDRQMVPVYMTIGDCRLACQLFEPKNPTGDPQ